MASLKDMRSGNRIRLLETLRLAGEADRAELARSTGLSRATVSGLLAEAIARGHVVERQPDGPHPAGRRAPALLRLAPRAGVVAGVDLGHSHVRVVLADLEGSVLAERAVSFDVFNVDAEPDAALGLAAQLVEDLMRSLELDLRRLLGAALGVPRPVSRTSTAEASERVVHAWTGAPPAASLSARLGRPVVVDNDAHLGALGERSQGAARGVEDFVYVKLSSGIGAGIVVGGALYTGARGLAGGMGHMTVVPGGHICRCGNRGCLETVASTRAIARALAPTHGDGLTLARLRELADEDDPVVERAFRDVGRHVGWALAPLCRALDVEQVVLGGELGAGSRRLLGGVRSELRRLPRGVPPPAVRPALLGERAEVLGAVALALSQEAWLHQAGLIALTGGDEGPRADASRSTPLADTA